VSDLGLSTDSGILRDAARHLSRADGYVCQVRDRIGPKRVLNHSEITLSVAQVSDALEHLNCALDALSRAANGDTDS
jgi:hypothetical protein